MEGLQVGLGVSKWIYNGPKGSRGDLYKGSITGLLSDQGEKSTNFYFIRVPLRKKY